MSRRNIVVFILLSSLLFSGLVRAQNSLFTDINVPSLPAGHEVTLSFEAQVPSDLAPGARISVQATVNADALASSVVSDDPATSGAFFDPTVTPTELGVTELPATGQSPGWRMLLLWGGPLLALGALFIALRSRAARTGITLMMLVFLAGMVVNAQNQTPAVFPLLVDGLCGAGDGDSFADADETICYRLRVINGESAVNLSALDIDVATLDTVLTPVSGSVSAGEPVCANLAEVNSLRERIGRTPLDSLPCDTAPAPAPAPDDNDDDDDDDDGGDDNLAAPTVTDDTVAVSNGATATTDLLANDDGSPAPTAVSFGGPDASNAGDVAADGTTTYTAPSGVIYTLNPDGTLTADASGLVTGSGGTDTIFYTIENSEGSATGTVSVSYGDFPTATDDTYQTDVSTNLGTAEGDTPLTDNDTLGTPAGTIVSFGGGDLGGAAGDNAAGSTVAFPPLGADAELTVNADGTWSATQTGGFNGGIYTFEYQLDNGVGTSTGTVTLIIEQPPVAAADTLDAAVGGVVSFPAGTLFEDNGSGADDLGAPEAQVSNFGNFNGGGAVTENVGDATAAIPTPIGGTLTINEDGSLTVENPTATGTFTVDYRLTNDGGTSDATVTINVVDAPVPADDEFTFLNTADQTALNGLFLDNGNGADALGTPAGTITGFGGGDLGGAADANAPGSGIALADGTLTVNSDGTWSLTGQPFDTSQASYTFEYTLANSEGSNTATVTLNLQQVPTAVADTFPIELGIVDTSVTAPGIFGNDTLGLPSAALVDYGAAGTRGDAAGTAYTLPGSGGVMVTVATDGSLEVDASAAGALTGNYDFEYQIQNAVGMDEALVTLQVAATNPPTAVDDGAFNTPLDTPYDSTTVPVSVLDNDTLLGGTISTLDGTATGTPTTTITTGNAATVEMDTDPGSANVGTFTYTPATGFTGTDTFTYTLDNGAGTNTATVTMTVGNVPAAQDDTSANGVTYTTTVNTALDTSVSGDPAITDNDTLNGADISIVGGTSCGGTFPCSGTTANGGTLAANSDGTFMYTPAGGFVGVDTVNYTLENGIGASPAATIEITVQAPPTAVDDGTAGSPAYTVGVNASTSSTTADGVRNSNDDYTLPNVLPDAEIVNYTDGVNNATVGNPLTLDGSGGVTVTIALDGTITIDAVTSGTAIADDYQVTYTLGNTAGNDTATVFIRVTENPVAQNDADTTLS